MEPYIKGNQEAWEEAFELRDPAWGADIVRRVKDGPYAFFHADAAAALRRYDLTGKTVGQFCCNNGRELLSLVRSANAKAGVGFDIARNMVQFANERAEELRLPCKFVAVNILELGDGYREAFDMVLITIGALCWFRDLNAFFAVVSRCMKPGGVILIHEQHPMTNMLAEEGDAEFDGRCPLNCVFSYFDREWIGTQGMQYLTGKRYDSKTFTDYTHPISEIIGAMCQNGLVITGMQEFDYDISDGFPEIEHRGFPLSMILEGRRDA